ncbi:hypothetical protein ES707_22595 [subsurface metagenome]
MKQLRFIGLASIFLVMLLGVPLEAQSEIPEPWHTFMDDHHLMQDRFLDFEHEMAVAEQIFIGNAHIPIRAPKGKTVIEREFEVVAGFSDSDFLVNDDTTGGCMQSSPSIAMDASGDFVICWSDWRNGNNDVYAQRFDASFNPQDTAFRVNDDANLWSHMSPRVAMDASGNFVICWSDPRTGGLVEDNDIYAQMYDAAGTPIGTNFVVNDDVGRNRQHAPQVGMNASGNFVICWHDYRNGDADIYAQMYDVAGNPQGANFRVDDDPGTNVQGIAATAMDPSGNFVICWYDKRNGNYDIYAQMYDAAGNPIGVNFRVDDDPGTSYQYYPRVVMDPFGDFVICWQDKRNGNYDIYAQMYDAAGTPIDTNFIVNDDAGTANQYWPSVAMDTSANFVISWHDTRNVNWNIYAQRFDAAGIPQGVNFKVNDDLGTANQSLARVAMDASGDFVICWFDYRNTLVRNSDIYAQMFDISGIPQHPNNIRVNDDVGTCKQDNPAVAMDNSGNFVICFCDDRDGSYDIWAQMYDASSTPQGVNFKVNDDLGREIQWRPWVAMDASGNFVICWNDRRYASQDDIYAQMYDAAGNPIGVNFRVDDDPGTNYQLMPSVAMDPSGNFVITWYDNRNGNYDIYTQMYDAAGNPIGVNFRVDDDPGTSHQYYPVAAMDQAGNFVICWYDYRNGNYDIYAQRYDAAGTPLDINFIVNDDATTEGQDRPSIAMDQAGNFVICWEDKRNLYEDIYAQRFDAVGTPINTNFMVNDDLGQAAQWNPAVTMDPSGNRFVIMWMDFRDPDRDTEIRAQFYENGIPVDTNVQINEPDPFPYCHQYSWRSSAACNSDTLVFVWQDNRRHKDWDIYATLACWLETGIEEDTRHKISGFGLRTHPNPFRSCITISGTNNELTIYDVSGRLIGRTKKGIWDGKDMNGREVESGVYFLKVESSVGCKTLKVIKLR